MLQSNETSQGIGHVALTKIPERTMRPGSPRDGGTGKRVKLVETLPVVDNFESFT